MPPGFGAGSPKEAHRPMDVLYIASQMVMLSLPIALGYAAHKAGIMIDEVDHNLSRIVLEVALPCLIVASIGTVDALPGAGTIAVVLAASAFANALALAVGFAATAAMRAPADAAGAYRYMIAFGNCSFMGFPVVSAVLGGKAVLLLAIVSIPANLLMFSVGVSLFSARGGWRRYLRSCAGSLKSPTLVASLLTLALVLAGVNDLGIVGGALDIVGQLTTPAALLIIGSSLARYDLGAMFGNPRAYIAAACRLLVVPLLAAAALGAAGVDATVAAVVVIGVGMPVATNGTLYCLQYGVDMKPMIQATFLSVVGSIATIPLLVAVL